MREPTRRDFLKTSAALAGTWGALGARSARAYVPGNPPGERPRQDKGIEVLHPRGRVPLSFIIDDSTCLVNMGHFCMPQFAAAWPGRQQYKKPWKTWPQEIPDDFVREFGQWCATHGVRGKYSIVPNPACVGWLDRELPGWSRRDLKESLALVRDLMLPNWDIHPEMITHTRVIDLKTGRPLEPANAATMENSWPQEKKSVDELAEYLSYALKILKNCGLPCEGVTTPGGFGNLVKPELSLAAGEALRDVYGVELPHYFKYVAGGKDESTEPRIEHASGLGTANPRAVINVPAGTGDWFGGWDGDVKSRGHLYSNDDATSGRMVELIERGAPAVMLCHWPGMYTQGTREGFGDFKKVVVALNTKYRDRTLWMKISEIARYWAARELTAIERKAAGFSLDAPFACPAFTLRVKSKRAGPPKLTSAGRSPELSEVRQARDLVPGSWLRQEDSLTLCLDLPKGRSRLEP
ncbi:MAG: twin-arginine translocation signal domain-containing protein [Planctomycetota bacterium]|nr:twin-arginine translocation signal domain-containing protein [Planctomycetota bacterium]